MKTNKNIYLIAQDVIPPDKSCCMQKRTTLARREKLEQMLKRLNNGEEVNFLTLLSEEENERLKKYLCQTTNA